MRVAELREKYTRRIEQAEQIGSEAPVAGVLEMVVEDLEELDRIGEGPIYLTTSDVADQIEVEPKTVAKWCREGRYPNAEKTGETGTGEWRIPADDLRGRETGQTVDEERVSFRDGEGGRP